MLFLLAGASAILLQSMPTVRTVLKHHRHFDISSMLAPLLSKCGPTCVQHFGSYLLSRFDRLSFPGQLEAHVFSAGVMGSAFRLGTQWHCTSSGLHTVVLSMAVPVPPVLRSPTASVLSCIDTSELSNTPVTLTSLAIYPFWVNCHPLLSRTLTFYFFIL